MLDFPTDARRRHWRDAGKDSVARRVPEAGHRGPGGIAGQELPQENAYSSHHSLK